MSVNVKTVGVLCRLTDGVGFERQSADECNPVRFSSVGYIHCIFLRVQLWQAG
jgi:hypothetical protein